VNDYTSQDELFDVVDDQDRVIGRAPRGEVHAKNLNHRAVHILIYNQDGSFFLQLRSPVKDRFPNCWDCSCSGHVDSGESYETAAWRELGEELGYFDDARLLPLRPLVRLSADVSTGHEFIQIYLLGPLPGPFKTNPDEIADGRFFKLEEVDELVRANSSVAGAFGGWWARYRDMVLSQISAPEPPTI
jgi:isopentenyl-diphosphate delta-isomerase type 1